MSQSIPNYELYGELLAGRTTDPVHHEPIRDRSSQHDWTIRIHKHHRLAQVFLFRSPGVRITLAEIVHTTQEPTLLIVPPGIPHGFLFPEDVIGDVVSVRFEMMSNSLQDRISAFQPPTQSVFVQSDTEAFQSVVALIDQIGTVYRSIAANRTEVLTGLLDLITLYLATAPRGRLALAQSEQSRPLRRQDIHAEAFCNLLEMQFASPWKVADYAGRMGLSAPQLTRICGAVLAAPPNNLIRQRRMLEAKRLLEYTALSLSEIAYRCGFKDPAFFNRTFKSAVGMPPNAYRKRVEHPYSPAN